MKEKQDKDKNNNKDGDKDINKISSVLQSASRPVCRIKCFFNTVPVMNIDINIQNSLMIL